MVPSRAITEPGLVLSPGSDKSFTWCSSLGDRPIWCLQDQHLKSRVSGPPHHPTYPRALHGSVQVPDFGFGLEQR
jgi:hypothetical protein